MNRRFRLEIAATLVALFAVMAMAESASAASGIEGIIFVSPSRPGPIRKEGPSKAPAANIDFVVKKADARVTSFTTDGEGRFRVLLPPGHYTVLREDPGAAVGHWTFEADVAAGEITKVTWIGNSGMR